MSVTELKKNGINAYKDLKLPPEVYESITEYHEEKAEAQGTN